jgi:hypothetical protein
VKGKVACEISSADALKPREKLKYSLLPGAEDNTEVISGCDLCSCSVLSGYEYILYYMIEVPCPNINCALYD